MSAAGEPVLLSKCLSKNSEILALEHKGFIIGEKVGEGTYAVVRKATLIDKKTSRVTSLACKILDIEQVPSKFSTQFFPRELEILTKIDNRHLIQVHSILHRGPRVFIFMSYAENGDLLDYVKNYGIIPEIHSRSWALQILKGLSYLHDLNIAHRDLKCENILLTKNFDIKIADFGFARYCCSSNESNQHVLSQTYCGSTGYVAPEIICGKPYNPKLADIWSYGIIIYVMLNASMPFDDSNIKALFKAQVSKQWCFRSKIKNLLSPSVKKLISQILEPDLTKRIRMIDIQIHEWFRENLAHVYKKKENTDMSFVSID